MSVYYTDDSVTLHHGDCIEVLTSMQDNSIDAVVTDPPYGISFMGKQWDQPGEFGSCSRRGGGPNKRRGVHDAALNAGTYDLSPSAMHNFQSWCCTWSTECLRVLKPGGHMLAFGGSRTWHRLASAIEDAGFEIRDSIAWLYGSRFPKSLDVSKAIDKAAGAERESIGPSRRHVSGKPEQRTAGLNGSSTFAESVGMGAEITAPATDAAKQWQGWGTALKPAFEPIVVGRKPIRGTVAANVLAYGTGALNIDACRVAHADDADLAVSLSKNPGRADTITSGVYGADRPQQSVNAAGRWPANVVLDEQQAAELDKQSGHSRDGIAVQRNGGGQRIFNHGGGLTRDDAGYGGGGGASRFFPTFRYTAKAAGAERPTADGIAHPTVKPLELMRWLIRLVTPPGGVVLDPFAGSGTVGEAAIHEHKRAVLIEREPTYLPLIIARLSKPMAIGFDFEAGA